MKRFVWVMMQVSILLTGLALATMARAEDPAIDSPPKVIELKDIHVRFKVKVFGLARIMGRFDRLRGELTSTTDGEGLGVRMHIDVDSINTDDAWRDDYLRGPTFFKAEHYPYITFSGSCRSYGENGSGLIVGDLSLYGTTKRVVFKVQAVSVPEGGSAGRYQATAIIRRSEFGLKSLQHIVSDKVEIIVAMNTDSGD
jgi:polyisoprenoid-binding protein YceI